MFARRQNLHNSGKHFKKTLKFKGSCNRCKKVGHRAIDCWANSPSPNTAGNAEEIALYTFTNDEAAYQTHNWCLHSGATSHMTAVGGFFKSLKKTSKNPEFSKPPKNEH